MEIKMSHMCPCHIKKNPVQKNYFNRPEILNVIICALLLS